MRRSERRSVTRQRALRVGVVLALVAGLGATQVAAATAEPGPGGGDGTVPPLTGDVSLPPGFAPSATDGPSGDALSGGGGGGRLGRAQAVGGPGYETLADIVEVLGDYTITLVSSPAVEKLRPYLTATASQLESVRGGDFSVAAGQEATATFPDPARGEINVKMSTTSDCSGDWSGCAGPRRAERTSRGIRATAGVIWIHPEVLSYPAASITNVVLHEVAHTLGLAHYDSEFEGQRQMMYPVAGSLIAYRNGDINGLTALSPVAVAPAIDVTPFASPAALVDRQARDFLDRPATAEEQSRYVGDLADGSSSPDGVIRAFALAPGGSAALGSVTRLYAAYFLRSPDDGGLKFWLGEYEAGRPLDDISEFFAHSAEFEATYGRLSNRSFVQQLYRNVLDREGETAGVDFWTAELDTGARSRGRVMTGFSESPEYRARTRERVEVVAVHLGMLGEVPERGVIAEDVATLENGVALTTIIGRIRATSAYAIRVT